MKDDILVSIITPTYDSASTIERTLDSVLNQTYKNYEYIIIDGGSRDDTINIIKKYESKFDGKMTYISEKDRGIYDAMNKGIRNAKGLLVGIVNSDDFYEPDALENMVNSLGEEKYQVLYGYLRYLIDNKEAYIALYNDYWLKDKMITHPTCFVTRSVYAEIADYDITYKSAADYDLMLKLHNDPKVVFRPVYKVISNFTLGGFSDSYIGLKEAASVLYKNGAINRKQFLKKQTIALAKKWLGILK